MTKLTRKPREKLYPEERQALQLRLPKGMYVMIKEKSMVRGQTMTEYVIRCVLAKFEYEKKYE